MGKSAWCDLNKDGTILKVDGMCPNRKCSCQKQVTFTPKQFQFEGKGFKNTIRKTFKGSQKAWDKLLKPAVKTLAPFIDMAVGAESKNPQVRQATFSILKSISGGKILSLTDIDGNE